MDFLSPVLKLIGSELLAEYARIHGISDKLKSWGEKLPGIQSVLDSAEEKQLYDEDKATVLWLHDLRDVAYDMEDLLDRFYIEAKRDEPKLQALSESSKLPHCLIAWCSNFRPKTLISGHYMANEIEDVDRRLDQVLDRIPTLGLVQNFKSQSQKDRSRFITTSLPEPKFVGRDEQIVELLSRLTGSEATDYSIQPFTVVSVVGMGGLGKTTLAQELYKRADFAVKAWVCVSDVFDRAAITKSILDQVSSSSSSTENDLNQLQNSLAEKLSGQKFLLVLDDVWNDNYEDLQSLLKPLHSGSTGSRILLTTRNIDVARQMGDRYPKQLDFLSPNECLSLLAYHSFGEENFERHPELKDIADKLAKKCKGLPLSIKAIGGLLRFETDDEQWKRVLAHGSWDKEGKIPAALKLSYIHLPIDLKRCFAACALLPKDYIFDQDELIRLWIIQGLLQKRKEETYQEVGMENIRRLEAVSFLQKARDERTRYSMHDLVNDLAKSVEPHSYFNSEEYKGDSIHKGSLDKVRHAAMVTGRYERCVSRRFDVFRSMKKLRTFMPFQISKVLEPNLHISEDVIYDMIMDMKSLKMLSLRFFQITQVPDQIRKLELLRSIDFSYTDIQILPKSICDLVELRSILLRGCTKLKKLPSDIHKLTNLLHLDISGTNNLQEMPPRICDLTNLEILSDFVVGKEVGQELKQLGPLRCLQRELHVHNLLDVRDVEDARITNLFGKEAIRELSLDWGESSEISREDDNQVDLLHNLQPPRKIESLVIRRYGAKRFPSWFNIQGHMKNVLTITLTGCRNVDSLPPFGQLPLLESLDITGFEAVSSIGPEFYGSRRPFFRSLRSLSFEDMGACEKWSSHGDDENYQPFPCLHQLKVKKCPKLKGGCTLSLPSVVQIDIDVCDEQFLKCLAGLTSMTKMKIKEIQELVHFGESLSTSWVALEEMRIEACPRFKSFGEGDGGKQVPPKLKILEIRGCKDLVKLPEDLCGLTSLNEMSVNDCEKLCSFPSGGLPTSLRRLKFANCPRLPPKELNSCSLLDSLEEVTLIMVDGLVSITELVCVGSPLSRSLRELQITNCRSLTTLTDSLQHLFVLSKLYLRECPALEVDIFPSLPYNIFEFWLDSCPKVKYLSRDMHQLTSLKSLYIEDCEGITSLPDLPDNLLILWLRRCPKVKLLPQYMHQLTSLKELKIRQCEGITRLPPRGLPPNLEVLWIGGCRNMKQPIEEWGLRGLTALQNLSIEGEMASLDEMECFPPADDADWSSFLPSSLLRLEIVGMNKLERMGGGLRHHLTSLQSLTIGNCERMILLPDDGLPDSLKTLSIWGSQLLTEKCEKGKGEYWSHLRLIPQINSSEHAGILRKLLIRARHSS